MTIQEARPDTQAIRRVYDEDNDDTTITDEEEQPAAAASASRIFHLPYYPDSSSGKDILLWDDILAAFHDVLHVRSGSMILPFLKGPDFKNLDPLRIAAVPTATLDVVVKGRLHEKELSLEPLQEMLPSTPPASAQTQSAPASTTTTPAAKQNPAGGLVEVAMQNYTHIDKPAEVATPPPPPYPSRGPQVAQGNQTSSSPATTENGPPGDDQTAAQLPGEDTPQEVEAPQEPETPKKRTPTVFQKFAEAQLKAKLGDMNA
ncbi:hypothetical protein BGW39_002517, partial [Mortierella sp. 14UC]